MTRHYKNERAAPQTQALRKFARYNPSCTANMNFVLLVTIDECALVLLCYMAQSRYIELYHLLLQGLKSVAGSKKAAFVYVLAAIMFIMQMIVSIVLFNDGNGALLGSGFVIIMLIGAAVARAGGLAPVLHQTAEYDVGGHSHVTEYVDTGTRIQCAPVFGVVAGIVAIIMVLAIGAELIGTPLFVGLIPGILGGVLGVIAAVIFIREYEGPYVKYSSQ